METQPVGLGPFRAARHTMFSYSIKYMIYVVCNTTGWPIASSKSNSPLVSFCCFVREISEHYLRLRSSISCLHLLLRPHFAQGKPSYRLRFCELGCVIVFDLEGVSG